MASLILIVLLSSGGVYALKEAKNRSHGVEAGRGPNTRTQIESVPIEIEKGNQLRGAKNKSHRIKGERRRNETFRRQFKNHKRSRNKPVSIEIENGVPNHKDGYISPFHTVPLYANFGKKIFNMVVDVPRCANATIEVGENETQSEGCNFHVWNHGALPQTWSDHRLICPHSRHKGNGEPLAVLDIGEIIAKRGEIVPVKILGVVGAFIARKIHWKVIAVGVKNPSASRYNDMPELCRRYPEVIKAMFEWLEYLDVPPGKRRRKNKLAMFGELCDKEFAHELISELHKLWNEYRLGIKPGRKTYPTRSDNFTTPQMVFYEGTVEEE